MKSLVCVLLILLCSWTAFGQDLAVALSLQPRTETQDAPSAAPPPKASQKPKISHKALWITVVVVGVVVAIVGSLAYTRFHNEGAI